MEELTKIVKAELVVMKGNLALKRRLKLRDGDINGHQNIHVVVLCNFPMTWFPFENVCFYESLRPRLKQVLITFSVCVNLCLNHFSECR